MIGATFEQLQVFVTLGRQGSLAGAARALGKSPSAVTAIMQVLEGVAGISLCDRTGYRAVLSAQGRDLLPRAELILREMQAWRAQAQSMATGIESELVIAIDALYSIEWIAPVLSTFRDRYPDVTLTLRTEISSRAVAAVITGDAQIGILVDFRPTKDLFRATPLGQVKLVAVCAPQHPLAQISGPHSRNTVHDHMQIVLGEHDRGAGEWGERGVLSIRAWHVTDMETKRRLLVEGVGWGSLPWHVAAPELQHGRLQLLEFSEWNFHSTVPELTASMVHLKDNVLGRAGQWFLAEILRSTTGQCSVTLK